MRSSNRGPPSLLAYVRLLPVSCIGRARQERKAPQRALDGKRVPALLNHPTAPLADGTINASGDTIEVVLVQTADMPAAIRIVWPLQPTVADPRRFPETAAMIARLFAEASTALAQIKARKRL